MATNNNNKFLKQLLKFILERFSSNLSRLVVIFPHQRAISFFQEEESTEKVSLHCLSFKSFILSLTHFKEANNIELFIKLHKIHKKIEESSAQSFENFLPTAQIMLKDFDMLDNAMSDVKKVYEYILKAKTIATWSPNEQHPNTLQQNYLELISKLPVYYYELENEIHNSGISYDGKIKRIIAENIKNNKRNYFENGKIYLFAGFNALTKAEKIILDHFITKSNGFFIWDINSYFLDDKNQHPAGHFIRKNYHEWKNNSIIFDQQPFLLDEKKIEIIELPSVFAEHSFTNSILSELAQKGEITKTVVVLNNPNLITDFVNKIPESIDFCISYPIRFDSYPIVTFFLTYFQVQHNILNINATLSSNSFNKIIYYTYNDILSIIQHPISKIFFFDSNSEKLYAFRKSFFKDKSYYYSLDVIHEIANKFFENDDPDKAFLFNFLFKPAWLINDLFGELINLLQKFKTVQEIEIYNRYAIEILLKIFEFLRKLNEENSISSLDEKIALFRLFCNEVITVNSDNKSDALHILGMLDTRCLDFENVIILHCNEGLLPKFSPNDLTFIPNDIRKEFNLEDITSYDTVQTYNFYRLLQRAKNVWLLYNCDQNDIQANEESRYIKQILYEIRLLNHNWKITKNVYSYSTEKIKTSNFDSIPKTQKVLNKIRNNFKACFSHAEIKTYLNCPVKFYFQYILKIKEHEPEAQQIIPANKFGTIVHNTLKDIYSNFIHKFLNSNSFSEILRNYKNILKEKFIEIYGNNFEFGKNAILYQVAEKMILNCIEYDKILASQQIKILYLEKKLQIQFEVNNIECTYYGKVDRIDQLGQKIRIIDYKTGRFENLKKIPEKFEKSENSENSENFFEQLTPEQFQLLSYLILYYENMQNNSDAEISAFIRPLQSKRQDIELKFDESYYKNGSTNQKIIDSLKDNFMKSLKDTYKKILNDNEPFKRKRTPTNCKFCPYDEICRNYN